MRARWIWHSLLAVLCAAASCSLPEYEYGSRSDASCSDGVLNGFETDTDCGGGCPKCDIGGVCAADKDCGNGSCVQRRCQASHCVDQTLADGESDVDCGGDGCMRCGVRQRCVSARDCTSNSCVSSRCIATGCDDSVKNNDETDLNCGGGTCPPCDLGKGCLQSGDCSTGVCLEGTCSTYGCGNGVKDDDELAADCGGSCPKPCGAGGGVGAGSGGAVTSGNGSGGLNSASGGGSSGVASRGGGTSAPSGGTHGNTGGSSSAGGSNAGQSGSSGAVASGGVATGGAASGGLAGGGGSMSGTTGGAASGGTATGGTASGGVTTGGTTTGGPESCSGCARLSVPLQAAAHKGNFVIELANTVDFSSAVITFRVFKRAGSGGEVKGYIQHGGTPDYLQLFQSRATRLDSMSGWQEIIWDLAAEPSSYDKRIVRRLGFQIIGTGSSAFTNPTIVYLDSIAVTGASAGPWTFDAPFTVSSNASTAAPPNVLWRNAGDFPVSGAMASWLGP